MPRYTRGNSYEQIREDKIFTDDWYRAAARASWNKLREDVKNSAALELCDLINQITENLIKEMEKVYDSKEKTEKEGVKV